MCWNYSDSISISPRGFCIMYQDNHIKYVVNCTSEMQRWTFRQSDWACLWGWPATTNGNKADCVENRSPPTFGQIQIRCSLKWGLQVWYCHTDCIQIGKLETSIAGQTLRSHFVRFVLPPVYCLILTNDGPLSLVSNMRGSKILSSLAPMLAHITATHNRKRMGTTQAGVDERTPHIANCLFVSTLLRKGWKHFTRFEIRGNNHRNFH